MMTPFDGRFSRLTGIGLLALAGVAVICPLLASAQAQGEKAQDPKVQDVAANSASKPADAAGNQPKQPTDVNLQHQKQLEEDTAKLLVLANELKVEMDKSTKDTLSLSVVKKAEEIEKLARKVRGEMKTSIGN